MQVPRVPTQQEKAELEEYEKERTGEEGGAIHHFVETAYIAVFDNFISDSPGYVGKVMLIVWPAGPSFFECFIWNREGKIERLASEINY